MNLLAAGVLSMTAAMAANGLDRTRLEKSLADRDNTVIVQAFKSNEEDVLGFIDEYFEGGLAAAEAGKPKSEMQAQYDKGVAFAKLADEALGGDTFSKYANAFTHWTPPQQKDFRQGQAEYRKASKVLTTDPATALAHLEKSLKLCTPLGDTWGQAMCMSKVAVARHALKKYAEAIEAATRAAALNESIHFLGSQAGDLLIRAQCHADTDDPKAAVRDVKHAVEIARRMKDAKRRSDVLKKCEAMYTRLGQNDAADALKKEASPPGK